MSRTVKYIKLRADFLRKKRKEWNTETIHVWEE